MAESAVFRRMVQALGIRLVVLADNRQMLVSNLSMSLDPGEAEVVAQAIRGRP